MEKSKEIVATGPVGQAMELLKSGGDVNSLEKMLELQERWEKNEAKKAYHEAMTEFKASPPKLIKTKNVSYGQTAYSHADLANVVEIINSALSNHGLSASWATSQENNSISVSCTITHVLGHSESTTLCSAPDQSGGKNNIQAIGSAVTYLQRYTILALTGLAAHDQDDDGNKASDDIVKNKLSYEIAELKTVPETEHYYRNNIKKYPNITAELIKMLAARKAEIMKMILKEQSNNDNS